MTGNPRRINKAAFSSHSYMLLLLFVIVVVFSIIALGMIERVHQIREVTESETARAAEGELDRAIQVVFQNADQVASDLAQWGEVNQQLHRPQYYAYWREQRLASARQYPAYVTGIELYNADGKVLAPVIGSHLPDRLNGAQRFLLRKDGKLYLVTFATVTNGNKPGEALGYVGMIWEFIPALLLLNHFTHLDSGSLSSLPGPDMRWPADRAVSVLDHSPVESPASRKLEHVVLDSVIGYGVILGICLFAVYIGVSRLFLQPLQQMVQRLVALRAAGVDEEDLPDRLVVSRLQEINELSEALCRYHSRLAATSRDLDQTNQELWMLAHADALSGVQNRRAFDRDWHAMVETATGQRMYVAFLLFDCDFFKAINDTYGHSTGDRLVQVLARILQDSLREGDKLYRMGGDEFAAILINADEKQAYRVAERCQKMIAKYPFDEIGIQEPVKVSIGLSVTEGIHTDQLEQLPRHADLAMYHAKRDRHHRICRYEPSMDRISGSVISSRAVAAAVGAAQGQGGIEMHYQPIINASSGQVVHYESLVRIRDHQGLLYPGDILPVIDQRTLQIPFDLNVIRSVCDDIAARHLPRGVGVSINMSAHALMQPNLLEHLNPLLPLVEQHAIIIEITETDLITQLQHVTQNLEGLRQHGVRIALDDFGSGYSSIRYLARMPVDIVKFDIEMIRDLESEPSRCSIVRNAARMVREAGYELVAEGIETQKQQQLATDMGASHLQGYLFGKPSRTPRPATISNAG